MKTLHAKCTFQGDTWTVRDVHCCISFPVALKDDPVVHAHMTEAQFRALPKEHSRFRLLSNIDEDLGPSISMLGRECWFPNRSRTHWPHGLTTYEGQIDLSDLLIEKTYKSEASSALVHEYRLTPNKWSSPWHLLTLSYTGSVEVDRADLLVVRDGEKEFEIDTRFDYLHKESKSGYEAVKSLVVRQSPKGGEDQHLAELHNYSPIDDICRLIQLASRRYVTCLGRVDSGGGREVQHFRLNRAKPAEWDEPQRRADYLVDSCDAQQFLQESFIALRDSGAWADRIRSAIAALVQPDSRTIEGKFVAHFSALEELVEQFTIVNSGSRILKSGAFKKLCDQIGDVLKKTIGDDRARGQIMRQLPALNNVPLQDRFEAFCDAYKVQYSDLWPAFSGSSSSLYKIRNRLVHSRALSPAEIGPVCYAADALQALLERCVLSLLAWPVSSSRASPNSFSSQYPRGWTLSKYITELENAWNAH